MLRPEEWLALHHPGRLRSTFISQVTCQRCRIQLHGANSQFPRPQFHRQDKQPYGLRATARERRLWQGDCFPLFGMRIRVLLFAGALLAALGLTGDTTPCGTELCDLIAAGNLAELRWPDFSDQHGNIARLYGSTQYQPIWVRDNAPTTQALAVIAALEDATVEGLNPQDFDAGLWQARIADQHKGALSPAHFDLELTVSAMRYASCLRFGCLNPNPNTEGFDLAAWVGGTLAVSNDPAAGLQQLDPPSEDYRRLKAALANYERIAWDDTGEKLPDSKRPIEPGQTLAGVPRLVALLRRTGDLPAEAQVEESGVYGGALVDAVKRFQARNGLEPDGRLGPETIEALNTPLVQRVQQLQLAMERVRWLPRQVSQRYIVVNIPEFRLRALDASGKTELQMKVVVGNAQRLQTPRFSADMKDVIFRPYWNVPLSIQVKELIPEIQKDPSYLTKNDYEITDSGGKVVSSGVVSERIMEGLRSGKLQIRQRPGPKNALGRVKFVLPNDHDV